MIDLLTDKILFPLQFTGDLLFALGAAAQSSRGDRNKSKIVSIKFYFDKEEITLRLTLVIIVLASAILTCRISTYRAWWIYLF